MLFGLTVRVRKCICTNQNIALLTVESKCLSFIGPLGLSNDPSMETKRYQSYCEGANAENKWAQMPNTMEYCCSAEENLTKSDVHMDIVNSSDAPNNKDNNFKTTETTMLRGNQNQLLPFPSFNNSFHNRKSETDSKELSKTVAESMGLYMNAAREADLAFPNKVLQEGRVARRNCILFVGEQLKTASLK